MEYVASGHDGEGSSRILEELLEWRPAGTS
jgi:hypothetical protein